MDGSLLLCLQPRDFVQREQGHTQDFNKAQVAMKDNWKVTTQQVEPRAGVYRPATVIAGSNEARVPNRITDPD